MKPVPSGETGNNSRRTILTFAAVVEIATGLMLMIDPAIVVKLLLSEEVSGAGSLIGRFFGIALLALGIACWPGKQRRNSDHPAFHGMLVYNALIALYLAYLGTVLHVEGFLLWPAMALHATVALLLVWTWLNRNRAKI